MILKNTLAYRLWDQHHHESPAEGVAVRYYRGEMEICECGEDWRLIETCVGRVGGRYKPDNDWIITSSRVFLGDWIGMGRRSFSLVVETRYQPQPLMIS